MAGHALIRDNTTGVIANSDGVVVYAVPDPSAETDGKVLTVASGAAEWDDPTGGGGATGPAGGVLSGTYPNPGFAVDMATQAELDAVAAAAQPLDADLTAIAALDSSTAGAIASDGAGWIKKTYAQFKTALSLVKGDVGLGSVDNTADSAKSVASAAVLTTARTIDGVSFNGSANITTLAEATHAATGKTTPVDADELPLVDSAASNVLKKLTWANLKATLKTYFDTLYLAGQEIGYTEITSTVNVTGTTSGTATTVITAGAATFDGAPVLRLLSGSRRSRKGASTVAVKKRVLPEIVWTPTQAKGSRNGSRVQRVVLHTWGGSYSTEDAEALSYHGVVNYFKNTANQASAHFVYPGSAVENEITQMVRYADYAWTEAAYNPTSVEIECADAIWQGHDPDGLEQLAHIVGFLLHKYRLPPVWSMDRGFCRHGDLGTAGGGHTVCPVALPSGLWSSFGKSVHENYKRGGYRKTWGR